MSKNRKLLSLGIVVVFVAAGLLVGRSEAQPEQGRRADPPLLVKIGDWRFNPRQVTAVNISEFGDGYLSVFLGAQHGKDFKFGSNGQAEALLEWFDANCTELKPKAVKKK